jgi:pyridoxine/pyridoxamine 5'-phosphate oxidase
MSPPPLPDFCKDIVLLHDEAWRRFARGVPDRRSPFHTPTLVTLASDGAPQARTLVLRKVDIAGRSLRFHTDIRSAKTAALMRDPRIAIHGYDPGSKFQLRFGGKAILHSPFSPVAQEAFARSQEKSRLCYMQALAPGAPVADPQTIATDAVAEANFSVIEVAVNAMEVLYLHQIGHRRAHYDWDNGALRAGWLAP